MRSKIIGKNIKKYRTEKGYSQKELAKKINRAYITIRTYECGNVAPSPYTMMNIAEVLGVSVSDLLNDVI